MSNYKVIGTIGALGEDQNGGAVAEAFLRSIKSKKTIVITSEHQNEGKSTTSRLMAERIAESGKPVLLIEADMRRRRVAAARSRMKMFVVPPKPYIETARYCDGFDIVSFDDRMVRPAQIISSEAFASLLRDAKDRYEVVIIDTPPLSHFNDAVEISKMADGVVLVHSMTRPDITAEMDKVVGVINTAATDKR